MGEPPSASLSPVLVGAQGEIAPPAPVPTQNPFAPPPDMFVNSSAQPSGNPFSDSPEQPAVSIPFASPETGNPFATPVGTASVVQENPFDSKTTQVDDSKKDPFASLGDPFADFLTKKEISVKDEDSTAI
eukprot:TRINITY_DN266_c0_g1_i1.p1 TRINITY_DN266_c0_g1~~TRINITY_DN266_c0_g1_i1.p1  ORF type:complete len:130 (-),score=24.85 TRINITY_DN266_c0_g1_i1:145-534(-)